jgi:3-hydroxyacyl-CoA dehydrogenase
MGARIAAHIANAGFPVLLLDRVPPGVSHRNRLAAQALEALTKAKPLAFADPDIVSRVHIGNFDDDLEQLRSCDWIVEAVAEDLAIKRDLLARIAPFLKPNAILTTNTSGLPVRSIAERLPQALRSRFFGTHFFNPPRYMRLVEIIATPETDPEAAAAVTGFCELHLGKTAVAARDTPNFIANRIGVFVMLNTFRIMREQGLSLEEVDALTGAAIGWPKTGTFRLADLVGIDVLTSVARNFLSIVHDERSDLELPAVLESMGERAWRGDKTGQGFYKKERGPESDRRLVLDLDTMEYRPSTRAKIPALELVKGMDSVEERIRALLAGDPKRDKAARFYRQLLHDLWSYVASRLGEISGSVQDIDRALKYGFNWELGPFEMWDAAGVAESVEAMRAQGQPIPPVVESLLAAGGHSWYRAQKAEVFDPVSQEYLPIAEAPRRALLTNAKRSNGVIEQNPGASLIDLGDGVACIEFHSKMNAIGQDIVSLMRRALDPEGDAVPNFQAFVIGGDAANFSVGANLMQVLLAVQDEEWDELDRYVREFQAMTQAIKLCPRPVVSAPFGLCFGGGPEVCLHTAARQAHLELYMGLVETGVGLIPAGGGVKEMLLRALGAAKVVRPGNRPDSTEGNHAIRGVFETIAKATVSSSAFEARRLGFLDDGDGITMNRDLVLADAKSKVSAIEAAGYAPPMPRTDIPAPGTAVLANLTLGIHMMREAEFISDHDAKVAGRLAHVLCGGDVPCGTPISEQVLLDLEREAFLSLAGEPKTVERIAYTLKTGKPLRN